MAKRKEKSVRRSVLLEPNAAGSTSAHRRYTLRCRRTETSTLHAGLLEAVITFCEVV
jgi:hypothetical protein